MKTKKLLLALAVITLLFAMTIVGCDDDSTDDGSTDNGTQKVNYESIDAVGNTYILTITEKTSRAVYKGTKGDDYVLTIKQSGQPDKESKGVVSTIGADGVLSLKPTKADDMFDVKVSSGKMTAITGTITLEDGEEVPAPGAVMPVEFFTSVASMTTWLSAQPANTRDVPYAVKLNVSDLGGTANTSGSAGAALNANKTKYVNLDLSGSTMTSIDSSAFTSCANLISITIPNSVTRIGESAFYSCTSHTVITVDSGNTSYSSEEGILYNKNKSTLIRYPAGKTDGIFTIPDSVTGIEMYAFQSCVYLTEVNIPGSVTSIGYGAFANGHLTGVTIPANITSIGESAFQGNPLTAINVDSGNSVYSSEDGLLYNKDKTILHTYPSGKTDFTFTIPDNVTGIGGYAFYNAKFRSVTIPASVTSIERYAFQCFYMRSVTFEGTITAANFSSSNSFDGDLRAKYLAENGGIGTYTTTTLSSGIVSNNPVWTKQ